MGKYMCDGDIGPSLTSDPLISPSGRLSLSLCRASRGDRARVFALRSPSAPRMAELCTGLKPRVS